MAPVGPQDKPSNGAIAVNEAELRGDIAQGKLRLRVPVESLTDGASGKLAIRLLSVDGTQEAGRAELAYDLVGRESRVLTVQLDAPASTQQHELVNYLVRIESASEPANGRAVRISRSLLHVVPLYELEVRGPKRVRQGRPASYRVRAQDVLTREPVSDLEIVVDVEQNGDTHSQTVTTSQLGDAVVTFDSLEAGAAQLGATARAHGTQAVVSDAVTVDEDAPKLLLTTDKPIYQPGQPIHLRALGLSRDDNRPLADAPLVFEVEDAKGNKVHKKQIVTDDFGVAATTFMIGQIVNQGTYKLRALHGSSKTEKTVQVSRYALPKFGVTVATERAWYRPAEVMAGAIDARYFFGKSAAGQVLVEAFTVDVGLTPFQSLVGVLDADGHYDFEIALPATLAGLPVQGGNAAVVLRVTVTDAAGQKVTRETSVPVSAGPARLALVPEASQIVPGVENTLLLFVNDPLGAPLGKIDVAIQTPDGEMLEARTDEFGQAELTWAAPASGQDQSFTAAARIGAETLSQRFDFTAQAGKGHLLVRTDKSVYEQGEEVDVEILLSDATGSVYVDWLNDGQAVDLRTLEVEDGRARFSMPVDTALLGDNRIEAYLVDAAGQIVRATRTVFARSNSGLSVELTTDKSEYAPGEPAALTFTVKDEKGEPAVAALGVQIVDEAVYGLIDAQPGLLRTYFELEDAFAQPRYEIHGPQADLSRLFFFETKGEDAAAVRAAQRTSAGALAALGTRPLMGIVAKSYDAVLAKTRDQLGPAYAKLTGSLEKPLQSAVDDALKALENQRCTPTNCLGSIFDQRFQGELKTRFTAFDFWGQPLTIQSASVWSGSASLGSNGPDEVAGNEDDAALSATFQTGLNQGGTVSGPGAAPNAGAPGAGGASAGAPQSPSPERPSGNGNETSEGPRIRSDFPETLYVNPAVITDARGKATVELGMADSITQWRVSTLANSADGKLGGGEAGVTVFQDFFVDIDFPATLMLGDEISFPIAVYNYLSEPQTVLLELEPAAWYTPLGSTTASITLEAGEVRGLSVPVRVESVGVQKLTVRADGAERSDAVARSVRVVPNGKRFARAQSGSLAAGSAALGAVFPSDAVAGSNELYLDVYPAFLAQVVSGMDSMLRVPNGCFEQTTSTAWPNVLVTDYMKQTKQITPEILLKAESLMSAGYQRLLTFEHPGGGFSWFGTSDPAPYLSVTAFGLMEFADMARVHEVDERMIQRTTNWLVQQQQGDGSFPGDMSEFFSFHTSTVRNTAFVVWALASAGYEGTAVDRGLDHVAAALGGEQDAYTLAIVANAFALARPDDPLLEQVIDQLEEHKQVDGEKISWDSGETQTNFYATGNDAAVSTTALVAHALLSLGGHPDLIDGALEFLAAAKDPNGNFGSTQATVWALRTLTLATRKGTESAIGVLDVFVDDTLFHSLALTADRSDVMTRIDLSSLAAAGEREVRLAFEGTGQASYNLVSSHHLPWSAVPREPAGPLAVSLSYDKSSLSVDEAVEATAEVKNTTASTQNMVLVTLGIPPGFSVETAALDASISDSALSRYEITGRQLILYITELPAESTRRYNYRLRATMPVSASDGGAEAHLYYEPSTRTASPATALVVNSR